MKQKSLNFGSSLKRNEVKKINGGKVGNAKECHDRIDGLYNQCVNGHCYSAGTGFCGPNSGLYVCEADIFDYCCCASCYSNCTQDSDCPIHGND